MSDLAQLMEEPPGGPNYGRQATEANEAHADGRLAPLDSSDWQAAEFMRAGGWVVVHAKDGARAGVGSHAVNQHTILHPDEYVDTEAVVAAVETELGFTVSHLHAVYCTGGRIPSSKLELRASIDDRLLELSRSGANMDLFGRVVGLNESTLDRALARARAKENA